MVPATPYRGRFRGPRISVARLSGGQSGHLALLDQERMPGVGRAALRASTAHGASGGRDVDDEARVGPGRVSPWFVREARRDGGKCRSQRRTQCSCGSSSRPCLTGLIILRPRSGASSPACNIICGQWMPTSTWLRELAQNRDCCEPLLRGYRTPRFHGRVPIYYANSGTGRIERK